MSVDVWAIARKAADLRIDLGEDVEMFFRRIPAGSFWMGSREERDTDEEPRHRVALPEDFLLGTFVVTQEQWRAVARRSRALAKRVDPSNFKGDRLPVEQVSWDDATAWCEALTQTGILPAGWEARLPTAAEWEYACRAGTDTRFYCGNDATVLAQVAWFADNSEGQTHLVDEPIGGQIEQHPWGLIGLLSNLFEWCEDVFRYDAYREREEGVIAPVERLGDGEEHGSQGRVVRGGSWVGPPEECRSAARGWAYPDYRCDYFGFRVCLVPRSGGSPARKQGAAGAGANRREVDLSREHLNRPDEGGAS